MRGATTVAGATPGQSVVSSLIQPARGIREVPTTPPEGVTQGRAEASQYRAFQPPPMLSPEQVQATAAANRAANGGRSVNAPAAAIADNRRGNTNEAGINNPLPLLRSNFQPPGVARSVATPSGGVAYVRNAKPGEANGRSQSSSPEELASVYRGAENVPSYLRGAPITTPNAQTAIAANQPPSPAGAPTAPVAAASVTPPTVTAPTAPLSSINPTFPFSLQGTAPVANLDAPSGGLSSPLRTPGVTPAVPPPVTAPKPAATPGAAMTMDQAKAAGHTFLGAVDMTRVGELTGFNRIANAAKSGGTRGFLDRVAAGTPKPVTPTAMPATPAPTSPAPSLQDVTGASGALASTANASPLNWQPPELAKPVAGGITYKDFSPNSSISVKQNLPDDEEENKKPAVFAGR